MNKLSRDKRTQIIRALVEGCSIRATSRMVEVSKDTVMKLLVDIGEVCAIYQDEHLRNLPCKRLELDEIWSFCHSKDKNVSPEKQGVFGFGDVWTWIALCADTKIVPCWFVGNRDAQSAMAFVKDLESRLANRVQITTDGLKAYLEAIEENFGCEVDYAMLVKIYGVEQTEVRYSPSKVLDSETKIISCDPDPNRISTSYVERQNLTMRMSMRRFTRLTNAFSKKIENHIHAISLHYMYYNFCRIHQSLRCSPAMAANVTKRLWSVEDIVDLLD